MTGMDNSVRPNRRYFIGGRYATLFPVKQFRKESGPKNHFFLQYLSKMLFHGMSTGKTYEILNPGICRLGGTTPVGAGRGVYVD